MDLREVIEKLEVAKGYMVTVSLLDDKSTIEHILVTEDFQLLDMLPSHEETRKLIIKQLESIEDNRSRIKFAKP